MDPRWRPVLAALIDVALIAVFVLIGRASHDEDPAGFVVTFWPFAVGLAVGWLAARGWRRPFAVRRTAVPAWLATVLIGVLLRALIGQGVQVAFVVVAAIVVGAFLIGWRVLLAAIDRSSTRTTAAGPVGRFMGRAGA